MKNIAEKLEAIIKQSENDIAKFDQISKFEDTLNSVQKHLTLEKPTYNFPQVDTIGKMVYASLNRNK